MNELKLKYLKWFWGEDREEEKDNAWELGAASLSLSFSGSPTLTLTLTSLSLPLVPRMSALVFFNAYASLDRIEKLSWKFFLTQKTQTLITENT